jgi:hypothetical protein
MTYKSFKIAYRSCDKPLKAKVFFILYPSRAVQLKFNNVPSSVDLCRDKVVITREMTFPSYSAPVSSCIVFIPLKASAHLGARQLIHKDTKCCPHLLAL